MKKLTIVFYQTSVSSVPYDLIPIADENDEDEVVINKISEMNGTIVEFLRNNPNGKIVYQWLT